MDSVDSAILNGFGRFGLHLLRYYLERLDKSNFKITHINDEKLQVEEMFKIIVNDKF
jgi:glyceraldehyde 3-phosphate dehydrogenase